MERARGDTVRMTTNRPYVEPTINAAERALRQSVIQRKISHGAQSAGGAICRSRLLTVNDHPAATGAGYLEVPGAGLDCPSSRWRDAIAAPEFMNFSTHAVSSLDPQH